MGIEHAESIELRDHHVASQPPEWSRLAQQFRTATEVPPRVTVPGQTAASADTWRRAPAIRREFNRGRLRGWLEAMAFYTLATGVLVLAFRALGVHTP